MTIYHNPRCSKSRETLALIQSKGIEPVIIEYLKNTPTVKELKQLLMKLNMKPQQLIRKSEPLYKEKLKDKNFTDNEWLKIMTENPILIERPIVVKGNKAVIGRPPENLLEIINYEL